MPGPWEKYQPKTSGPWEKFSPSSNEYTSPESIFEKLDSYTGAPTRALMGAAQEGKSYSDQFKAFGTQFGENPSKAPTGQALARGLMIPDKEYDTGLLSREAPKASKPNSPDFYRYQNDPNFRQSLYNSQPDTPINVNPSKVAGGLLNVTTDWTNLAGPVLKGAKAGVEATELGAQALNAGSKAIGSVTKPIFNAAGKAAAKVASAVSGVPEDLIRNYASKTHDINQMIRAGGEGMEEGADALRQEISSGIQKTKKELNQQVQNAIQMAPKDARVPVKSILDKLEAAKSKLDPDFGKSAISEIQEMIDIVNKKGANGSVSLSELHTIKEGLQDMAKSSYLRSGQIFNASPKAAQAAKGAAAEARKLFNPLVPEAAKANNQLSLLHQIEGDMNRNLIAPGKPSSAIFSAGSGANPRNAKNLERLGQAANVDALGKAKDLATARAFQKPSLLPTDATGKAVARQAGAGLLGTALGGPVAGMIAGAAASPAAVKVAINAGRVPIDVVHALAGTAGKYITPEAIKKASDIIMTPEGFAFYKTLMGASQVNGLISQGQNK